MAEIKDPENTIIIELKGGPVTIELLPDVAPKHVERMKELARAGAYDNVVFHRVIDGFMAQTGDVENGNGDGLQHPPRRHRRVGPAGPAGRVLEAAASTAARWARRARRTRTRPTRSSSSTSRTTHFLNGQYTVYGRVIDGMEHVDAITRGEPPANPDRMISVKVAADA